MFNKCYSFFHTWSETRIYPLEYFILSRAFSHSFITLLKAVKILPPGRMSIVKVKALLKVTQGMDSETGAVITGALDLLLRVPMWRDQMKTLRPKVS